MSTNFIKATAVCLIVVWGAGCTTSTTPSPVAVPTTVPPAATTAPPPATVTNISAPVYSLTLGSQPNANTFEEPDWADTVIGLGQIWRFESAPNGEMIAIT